LRISYNATDFRMAVEQAAKRFADRRERWMKEYGPKYADKPEDSIEATLEHVVRTDFLDDVLRALNWSLTVEGAQEPNLLAELPIVSADTGRTKFIDYLGLETRTGLPLLIVEAKRFGSPLPSSPKDPESEVPSILADALAGRKDRLTHDWPKWLAALGEYVRSAHEKGRAPRRAAITDGHWLIVFTNPEATFVVGPSDTDAIKSTEITFFFLDDISGNHKPLFNLLEYQKVLGEHRPLTLAELPFHVRAEYVACVMHGVRVLYIEDPEMEYDARPRIKIKPVLLLGTTLGGWIVIEEHGESEVLPTSEDLLPAHLDLVEAGADTLIRGASARLGRDLVAAPLTSHYEDSRAFGTIAGVERQKTASTSRLFLVATGQQRHYLRAEPSIPACPFHEWSQAHGSADAPRIPSIQPPSFFTSGGLHYCGHRNVESIKRSPATEENRDRTGPRSDFPDGAFCELWALDHFLCCRTCTFEEVCGKSSLFQLPCRTEPIVADTVLLQ
jgi:hypothetical protein